LVVAFVFTVTLLAEVFTFGLAALVATVFLAAGFLAADFFAATFVLAAGFLAALAMVTVLHPGEVQPGRQLR
jgi:hypothetical protein